MDTSRWRTKNSAYRRVDEKVGPHKDMPDDEDLETMDEHTVFVDIDLPAEDPASRTGK